MENSHAVEKNHGEPPGSESHLQMADVPDLLWTSLPWASFSGIDIQNDFH